ncbi:hypothetical protein Ciccas_010661 [Cichlidogyrus casuarinus]|uniref:Uncharacterized protein n=1 Tax=Cichlidogyrus casuarinus TaxID=1844966 RepID=A0ABD2PUN5_9PLAT
MCQADIGHGLPKSVFWDDYVALLERSKTSSRLGAALVKTFLRGNPGGVHPDQISSSSLRYHREKIKAATLAKRRDENTHIECIGFDSRTEKGHGQREAESHLTIVAYPSLKFIDIGYPSDGSGEQYAQTVLRVLETHQS